MYNPIDYFMPSKSTLIEIDLQSMKN